MIAKEMINMNNLLNKYSLIIIFVTTTFINPSLLHAQSSSTETPQPQSTNNQNTNSGGSPFNAGSIDAAMNSSSSANTASGGQGSGAMMNFAGSGIMAGIGAAFALEGNGGMAKMFFLQAALAAAQAGMQMGTSGGNKGASKQFLTNPTFSSPELGGGPQGPGGDIGAGTDTKDPGPKGFNNSFFLPDAKLPPNIQSVIDKMNADGYKVDLTNGTFTTPDGKSISLKDASNGSKVEAKLGLPAGTYAKGMEMVNEVYKKNGFGDANAMADSIGGGGINSVGDNQNEGYDGSGGKGNRKDANASGERAPASALVAGLTTKYNGENIGVAADDIFSMVSRRYSLKTLQDSFITPDRPAKGMLGETAFMNPKK